MDTTDLTGAEQMCRYASLRSLALQVLVVLAVIAVWALCMGLI